MTLKDLSHAEWETLRQELRSFRGTLLHHAMLAYLADYRTTCMPTMLSPTTDYAMTQFVRGQLTGLDTAAGMLDELERKAARIGT